MSRMLLLYILMFFSQLADITSTAMGLYVGAVESNQFLVRLAAEYGYAGPVFIKLVLAPFWGLVLMFSTTKLAKILGIKAIRDVSDGVVWLFSTMTVLVAMRNLVIVGRLIK